MLFVFCWDTLCCLLTFDSGHWVFILQYEIKGQRIPKETEISLEIQVWGRHGNFNNVPQERWRLRGGGLAPPLAHRSQVGYPELGKRPEPRVELSLVFVCGSWIICRRKWQPTREFLPVESHAQISLVSPSPWGWKDSDMTERLTLHLGNCWLHWCIKEVTKCWHLIAFATCF